MHIRFGDVIKSADVEDPVNLRVHRPLQYLILRGLLRDSSDAGARPRSLLTPNRITLLALAVGLGGAAAVVTGSLAAAGALLFTSAILDGVDGMVARITGQSSEIGHALDGAADFTVALAAT